jgi:hypothetical protein
MPVPRPPTETLRPDPGSWASLARACIAARARQAPSIEGGSTLSAELGLPAGPLVWSGHQATFWHPGILAKRFAASAVAIAVEGDPGAQAVWLVVDQDAADASTIAMPALTSAGARSSTRLQLRTVPSRTSIPGPGSPGLAKPELIAPDAALIASAPSAPAFAHDALARLAHALNAARPAANQAQHVTRATDTLLADFARPVHTVYASALASTTLFREMCERMLREPERCARCYNQAALEHPDAALRPLECSRARVELPLWKLGLARLGSPRQRVFASDLVALLSDHTPGGQLRLLPKALLMTAIVRLGAASLFIHGLGGERYDPATERWLALWLGDEARLAPAVAATADLYLSLEGTAPPTTLRARNAHVQQLRRLRYQPLHPPVIDGDLAQRREALAAIASLPRRSAARRAAYQRLIELTAAHRARNAAQIAEADAARAKLLADTRDPDVPDTDPADRRDWPFFLYPREDLIALRDRINARFA